MMMHIAKKVSFDEAQHKYIHKVFLKGMKKVHTKYSKGIENTYILLHLYIIKCR